MNRGAHWSLGAKLALVATPFLAVAMVMIGLTLWVSWQLDGGAAAVNEAGRMRMQSFRLALSVTTADAATVRREVDEFNSSLAVLRDGDPQRPLFVPWDDDARQRFAALQERWQAYRGRWVDAPHTASPASLAALRTDTDDFAGQINAFVSSIETHLSRWTAILHLLQAALMGLAIVTAAALLYAGYLFVLAPVGQIKQTIEQLQAGDFSARVGHVGRDEFGTLALGFNNMADHLQALYKGLEAKVAEKTAELEEKRERLQALYDVTSLVAQASSLDELARGFTHKVARVARADGVALRWSDEANERYLMLASLGLPQTMVDGEHCVHAGQCHCGQPGAPAGARVIPIRSMAPSRLGHCEAAGFSTVVSVPIRMKDRLMGELDLFHHARIEPSQSERSLLEALAAHLGAAMESLRLNALEKEAAVSRERELLARELHDSIAQSLAFLKIQVQLMRDAMDSGDAARMRHVLAEIELGVLESYGDVRELLLNFRTRANEEDIALALQTTLRKFEHHSGMRSHLSIHGHGLPLPGHVQVQVLHVIQEALSNARKHSQASQVWLTVRQQPQWSFEVRDDGVGFGMADTPDETHVGHRIMAERAASIGASLEIQARKGAGCTVTMTLPSVAPQAAGSEAAPGPSAQLAAARDALA